MSSFFLSILLSILLWFQSENYLFHFSFNINLQNFGFHLCSLLSRYHFRGHFFFVQLNIFSFSFIYLCSYSNWMPIRMDEFHHFKWETEPKKQNRISIYEVDGQTKHKKRVFFRFVTIIVMRCAIFCPDEWQTHSAFMHISFETSVNNFKSVCHWFWSSRHRRLNDYVNSFRSLCDQFRLIEERYTENWNELMTDSENAENEMTNRINGSSMRGSIEMETEERLKCNWKANEFVLKKTFRCFVRNRMLNGSLSLEEMQRRFMCRKKGRKS